MTSICRQKNGRLCPAIRDIKINARYNNIIKYLYILNIQVTLVFNNSIPHFNKTRAKTLWGVKRCYQYLIHTTFLQMKCLVILTQWSEWHNFLLLTFGFNKIGTWIPSCIILHYILHLLQWNLISTQVFIQKITVSFKRKPKLRVFTNSFCNKFYECTPYFGV